MNHVDLIREIMARQLTAEEVGIVRAIIATAEPTETQLDLLQQIWERVCLPSKEDGSS